MVEWLAGNRIIGTTAERPVASLQSPSVGGWVEVGRTTLGSAGDTISVTGLADKRYYMLIGDYLPSGNFNGKYRINNDSSGTSGSTGNYARRNRGTGNTSDTTALSQTEFQTDTIAGNGFEQFDIGYVSNLATKEKLILMNTIKHDGNGAGTAIKRIESVGKWANTSNTISRFDTVNSAAGSFATGSELIVLGWDPADTHTTNFWEELASVTASGNTETFETGTFSAKKYLWVQAWIDGSGSNHGLDPYVNSDIGNNYSYNSSANGGTDVPATSEDQMGLAGGWASTEKIFFNAFIVNNSSTEKFMISHTVSDSGSTLATAATNRRESAGKWVTTGTQITKFGFKNRNTNTGQKIDAGSIIKVWGSD